MRVIPNELQAHIAGGVTTLCRLLKIVLRDGRAFGATTLDRNINYRGLIYYAGNGFDSSIIASDNEFSVDNAESTSLFAADIPGITSEMAMRGELDGATWEMMIINYNDLTMGHILLDAGDIGEIRSVRETVFIPELLSYSARLHQTIGHVDSRTCRAIFGSELGTQTGCGVNANVLWQSGTATSVSLDEPHISFLSSGVSSVPVTVPVWRLRWVSGDNVSERLYQVEAFDPITGQITLTEPLAFMVSVGDAFEIRPDCDKRYSTCRTVYFNSIEFKGENLIPTGEASDTPNV